MENWNNLNPLLDSSSKSLRQRERESQELVELSAKGEKESIKKMLKSGATINCFADNSTPLISAVENDKFELATYLLSVRASISYKQNEANDDALWYALKNKKHQFLELFVLHRCLLSLDSENRLYPLIYATIQSDVKSVEILLNHYRINVNERDGGGNTALHHNVSKENPSSEDLEIGKLLVAAGADTNARNMEGKTPEEAATDFSARSMLLSSKMDRDLDAKPDVVPDEPDIADGTTVTKTKTNKIKI